jgi:branched-chain amino acid aminotransferase
MLVWLNGEFVERDQAVVAAFDAGLQHGIGLFETMSAQGGAPFRAEAHARRLVQSARELLLSDSLRAEPLAEAVALAVRRNDVEEARIRLTITGGNLNAMTTRERSGHIDPTILIDVQPPTRYPDAFFTHGVMVTIAEGRLNPLSPMAGHKTLNYWPRIHALQHAAAQRGGEALWFTVGNRLAGGSVSNVFLVRDGRVLTPWARGEEAEDVAGRAVLPGITRAAILELCDELEIDAGRQVLDIDALLSADEVFLTNSSWGVLPVVAVEKEKVATGEVGAVTARLRQAWLDLVARETAGAT